jgi:hypothetical protein
MEMWAIAIFAVILNLVLFILLALNVTQNNKLKTRLVDAQKNDKKSSDALSNRQERCREQLMRLCEDFSRSCKEYSVNTTDRSEAFVLFFGLMSAFSCSIQRICGIYEDTREVVPWLNKIFHRNTTKMCSGSISAGHLVTWRTEIAALQVYLYQLDGRGRMGMDDETRSFTDDELISLSNLKGGMRWIIERTLAGNCPFPFGPNIGRDLDVLIKRIEAVESKTAKS